MDSDKYLDKIKGAILGFAIGDAMGAPVEFSKEPLTIKGFEPSPKKGLQPGQYTDDTQHLELSLDSLLENSGEINLNDQADRLVKWYRSGDARSMGRTTEAAIKNLIEGAEPNRSGIDHIRSCGSLAIARLAPYSVLSAVNRHGYKITNPDTRKLLGITHAHKKVYAMGNLVNYLVQEGMHGRTHEGTVNMILHELEFNKRIRSKLEKTKILSESDDHPVDAIEIIGYSGFVEDVMFSSIYAAMKGSSFEDAVLIAANGKGDTDSRASITGMFYGIQVGVSGIPEKLRKDLERSDELEKKAADIYFLRR